MSQHKKNISVKCKILLKNILSYLFLIRYLKFMLKRRTASAGFFSQSGTIKSIIISKKTIIISLPHLMMLKKVVRLQQLQPH
ncbi:hypothetical protein [Candidatus Tisiphia endosymbiont of Parasteatoda lunata]|uniref:hypothetical protein n=1 Tax=Candidatus Tisiphia endosymbiont of Parasteatoda lunata TaxID=3066275 RepID=UPI00313C4049